MRSDDVTVEGRSDKQSETPLADMGRRMWANGAPFEAIMQAIGDIESGRSAKRLPMSGAMRQRLHRARKANA